MKYFSAVLLMALWAAATVALAFSCIGVLVFILATNEWFDIPAKILKVFEQ